MPGTRREWIVWRLVHVGFAMLAAALIAVIVCAL